MDRIPRLAIVEDDPVLLDILSTTLINRGYDVAPFSDGGRFLAALEGGETPDVAILDVRLLWVRVTLSCDKPLEM